MKIDIENQQFDINTKNYALTINLDSDVCSDLVNHIVEKFLNSEQGCELSDEEAEAAEREIREWLGVNPTAVIMR